MRGKGTSAVACRSKTVGSVLSALLLGLAALAAAPGAAAGDPSAAPVLRVETDGHTSMIRRIVVDPAHNRVVTAGDDKTLRVWQMPDQHLVRTLRVPLDAGHEGQLFGLAISPDGATVAVGGWTGWDWDREASVYLFDTLSGELRRRIGGFPDAIHALAWSPDGQFLAVGLQGRAGLSIRRVADGREVARDAQYRDKLTDLDFSAAGRLAAASLDGYVRLYNEEFRLIGRRIVPGGKQPLVLRFSPDAQAIAIGFVDAPRLTVVSARDLEPLVEPSGKGLEALRSILALGWSADGKQLYAGGDSGDAQQNAVFRWEQGGRGAMRRIAAARQRIVEIQPMAGGRMVFAAEDPGFGTISADGRLEAFREPEIVDFTHARGRLEVSADGAVVRYPFGPKGALRSFSVLAGADQTPSAAPPPVATAGPLLKSSGLVLADWQDSPAPLINGQRPQAFDDYEVVRSYAFAPDGASVLLGTEWALRLLDRDARQRWSVKLAAVARAVNVSADGKLAVAALSDGTIRWIRMQDGAEVFAYFPHRNGTDWIAWEPRGYYMSSYFGDRYVGWHVNRGRDATPDFFRAVQFDRILYRPDLVVSAFRAARGDDGAGALAPGLFDIGRLAEIAPPRLRVIPGAIEASGRQAELTLTLRGDKGGAPTQDVAVYVNGIPVTPGNERTLDGTDRDHFTREVRVPLFGRDNRIRVEAFNGLSMGVDETYVAAPPGTAPERTTGDLYVLAIGVNTFPNLPSDTYLAFAAQDAEAMAQALRERGKGVYREIHVRLITDHTDEKPLRDTITRGLEFVRSARGNDTVVVFLASHGISDKLGDYYFVPRDASTEDIDRLIGGGKIETLVPWTTFFNGLRMAAGRRLLIVDTCQASKIEGRFESHSFLKRSAASLFSLMLASKGGEYSQEHAATGHGLFTYSLLAAMDRKADADHNGLLTQQEIFATAARIVDRDRDRRTGPQTPQLVAPDPLGDTPLVGAARKGGP